MFEEAERIADVPLDPLLLAANPDLKEDEQLGRLQVSAVGADADGDGGGDRLQAFSGRSLVVGQFEI
jgi:hypothetical protein